MRLLTHSDDLDTHVTRLLDGADPHDVARAALARHGASDLADMPGLNQEPPPQPIRRRHRDDERALVGRRERG